MKDISNISKDFEKLPYEGYVQKRPKHDPTDSYFCLERHLANCMIRDDAFNSHIDHLRTDMTGTQYIPISDVFYSDEIESK